MNLRTTLALSTTSFLLALAPSIASAQTTLPGNDPQRAFDSRFLMTLTQQGLERVRAAYAARGRAPVCEALLPLLTSPPAKGDLAALSAQLGMPANTLAVELKRLRERLAGAMRVQLSELCVDAQTAEREWQQLRR